MSEAARLQRDSGFQLTRYAWWRRLSAMTIKELRQLYRDRVLLFFLVYAFTADVYWAGSGVSLQLNHAAFAVHDSDRSAASRDLISRFQPPYFEQIGQTEDARRLLPLLDSGKATVVMDIPPRFEASLHDGRQTAVQMQVDATNSVLGQLISAYSTQIVTQWGMEETLARSGITAGRSSVLPVIEDDHRIWFNPNQTDSWFMTISEMLNVITVLSILLPAAAMVREKEKGTIEQLLVSPLTPFEILFPKVIAMAAVILAGTSLCLLGIVGLVFHVPFRGSITLFFVITTLYVFTTAGIGLFAASISQNQAQVGMVTILILAPMLFLSGAWTPPEALPVWLRDGMYISPMHYYIDLCFGVVLKGAGWKLLWPSITAMSSLGAAVFGFGVWRFRKQFA